MLGVLLHSGLAEDTELGVQFESQMEGVFPWVLEVLHSGVAWVDKGA